MMDLGHSSMMRRFDDLMVQFNILRRNFDSRPRPPVLLASIARATQPGSLTSVTLSSIPANFKHLLVTAIIRSDRAAEFDNVLLRFNADSGANYDYQELLANNVTVSATPSRGATSILIGITEAANSTASNFAPVFIFIPEYANTNNVKHAWGISYARGNADNNADLYLPIRAGSWQDTSAITSVTLLPQTGPNFVANSSYQVYGVG